MAQNGIDRPPPGCLHELEADENIKKGATNRLHCTAWSMLISMFSTKSCTPVRLLSSFYNSRPWKEPLRKESKSVGVIRTKASADNPNNFHQEHFPVRLSLER
jgi:hypothetical protein